MTSAVVILGFRLIRKAQFSMRYGISGWDFKFQGSTNLLMLSRYNVYDSRLLFSVSCVILFL